MRIRMTRANNKGFAGRGDKNALKYAVQLAASQISQGINHDEAVQFAAKYHNVTCVAIEGELSKKALRLPSEIIPRSRKANGP